MRRTYILPAMHTGTLKANKLATEPSILVLSEQSCSKYLKNVFIKSISRDKILTSLSMDVGSSQKGAHTFRGTLTS